MGEDAGRCFVGLGEGIEIRVWRVGGGVRLEARQGGQGRRGGAGCGVGLLLGGLLGGEGLRGEGLCGEGLRGERLRG